jgi:hypothetical protein
MAKGVDVLNMLCPAGGWIIVGDDFDGITFVDERPRCTKAEFEAGFAQYDDWKAEQDAQAVAKKAAAEAKLAALGLTTDDLKALGLGGN